MRFQGESVLGHVNQVGATHLNGEESVRLGSVIVVHLQPERSRVESHPIVQAGVAARGWQHMYVRVHEQSESRVVPVVIAVELDWARGKGSHGSVWGVQISHVKKDPSFDGVGVASAPTAKNPITMETYVETPILFRFASGYLCHLTRLERHCTTAEEQSIQFSTPLQNHY